MDYKLKIGNVLNPVERTVSKTDTPAGALATLKVPFTKSNVMLNGRVLTDQEINSTFEVLAVRDGDAITVSSKQNSGLTA